MYSNNNTILVIVHVLTTDDSVVHMKRFFMLNTDTLTYSTDVDVLYVYIHR